MIDNILTDSELRRFHFQMNLEGIGQEGQEQIKLAKVAVIGAGGLGTSVLQYLASIGIGSFGIIDDGLVDETNIQKQTLYGAADLGKLKTIITRQKLQSVFPLSKYEIINLRLISKNITQILQPFSVVIDATNNLPSHILINDACVKSNKYWVYGSVKGNLLQTSVFNYSNGPSFRCYQAVDHMHNVEKPVGNISVAYGFAGILMATEVVKILTSHPDVLSGKMFSFNILNYQSKFETIKRIEKFFPLTSV